MHAGEGYHLAKFDAVRRVLYLTCKARVLARSRTVSEAQNYCWLWLATSLQKEGPPAPSRSIGIAGGQAYHMQLAWKLLKHDS